MSIFTVACPSCETSFPVDPDKVPRGGVRARCSVCGGIFPVAVPTAAFDGGDEQGLAGSAAAAPPAPAEPPLSTVDRVGEASFPEGGPDPDHGPEPWSGITDDEAPEGVELAESDEWAEEAEGAAADEWSAEADHAGADQWAAEVEVAEQDEWSAEVDIAEPDEGVAEIDAGPGEQVVEVEAEEQGETVVEVEASYEVEEAAETRPDSGLEVEPAGDLGGGVAGADAAAGAADEAAPLPQGFQFGRRDPHDKARRLARVLVSDIITYNPERYLRALENDTLQEDFDEEIRKSWSEYVEQVGSEMARETSYWTEALNDLLARGRQVF